MPDVELVLCSPEDESKELRLYYDFFDTPIAKKHLECLRTCEEKNLKPFENDRFHHFPNDYRDRTWIANEINRYIDVINEFSPNAIIHRAEASMGQEHLNVLHHYFEVLRGGRLSEGELYAKGPPHIKKALEQLNLLVHRFEGMNLADREHSNLPWPAAWAIMTYHNDRYLLDDEDYDHFTLRSVFGSWSVDYCEVGKQIWDIYQDKDEIVGDDNIRPLRYYSSDSLLRFSPTVSEEDHQEYMMKPFWKWWDENTQKLSALGFNKYDKKNSLGYLLVGQLNRDMGDIRSLSEPEIIHLIGNYQRFKSVHVLTKK